MVGRIGYGYAYMRLAQEPGLTMKRFKLLTAATSMENVDPEEIQGVKNDFSGAKTLAEIGRHYNRLSEKNPNFVNRPKIRFDTPNLRQPGNPLG